MGAWDIWAKDIPASPPAENGIVSESSRAISNPSCVPVSPQINESGFREPGSRHYCFKGSLGDSKGHRGPTIPSAV